MINFDFGIRTKLFFGKDRARQDLGNVLESFNVKKTAIVIGQGSIRNNGLLDSLLKKVEEKGIEYIVLEGVRPNPTRQLADAFLKRVKEYRPDLLLAIGGGSVIDTAKYISVGYYYEGNAFDFNLHIKNPERALPIGVVLTISAAGSEMSNSCVIQDDDMMIKRGFNSEFIRPLFAIEDPTLTYQVSKYQTGCGVVDIMMHTLERYFRPSDSENELADNIALGLLKTVKEAGEIAINNPTDYQARANLMLASSFSHNGLTNIGKPFFMPVHQLEHALSGVYPQVAHGAGLSVLFPAWAEFFLEEHSHKLAVLGRSLFDIKGADDVKVSKETVKAFKEYFSRIGMPIYLEECDINQINIDKLVEVLLNKEDATIDQAPRVINRKNARIIYESCLRKL